MCYLYLCTRRLSRVCFSRVVTKPEIYDPDRGRIPENKSFRTGFSLVRTHRANAHKKSTTSLNNRLREFLATAVLLFIYDSKGECARARGAERVGRARPTMVETEWNFRRELRQDEQRSAKIFLADGVLNLETTQYRTDF